jgi:cytochrome c oxidase assembly factor CtaG
MIPYLLLADIQNTALAAALVFAERILYPTYLTVPRVWGISALDDQAAAGVIMWVPGSLAYLVPVGWLVMQLLNAPQTYPQDTTRHAPSTG